MGWRDDAIAYLQKHRDYVARDLARLRAGQITICENDTDASARWIGRYQRELAHLDRLIAAYKAKTAQQ
jgi:hypothetical protein